MTGVQTCALPIYTEVSQSAGFAVDVLCGERGGVTLRRADFPQQLVVKIALAVFLGCKDALVFIKGDGAFGFELRLLQSFGASTGTASHPNPKARL